MASSRFHRAVLTLGVAACALGAVAWWMWPRHSVFYTDADTIRQSRDEAHLRDILWTTPEVLPGLLNAPGDEVEPRVSADGRRLYFARRTPAGDSDLYVAEASERGWGEPVALSSVNTSDNELGPTPSPDGAWLYFASDRPGGLGGFDLWRVRLGETGWGGAEHLGDALNSASDEVWPALSPDGTRLYFSSDRPVVADTDDEVSTASGGFDIYTATHFDGVLGRVERIEALASVANEVAPSCSPVGDFLYFASDRTGGNGGYDLYRARFVDGEHRAPERLGTEVNTPANELDPTLSMGGFALFFSSDRAGVGTGYDLYRSTSREVFLGEEVRYGRFADLLGLLPWILAALALVLLLSLLRRSAGSEAWRVRWGTLSLMAKCVLVSLVLHAGLLALLTLWNVKATPGQLAANDRSGISLTSSALASAMQSQLHGGEGDAPPLPETDAPMPHREARLSPVVTDETPRAATASRWSDERVVAPSLPEATAAPTSRSLDASSGAASVAPGSPPVRVATPEANGPRRASVEAPVGDVGSAAAQPPALSGSSAPRAIVGSPTTSSAGVDSPIGEDRAALVSRLEIDAAPSSTARPSTNEQVGLPSTSAGASLDVALPQARVPVSGDSVAAESMAAEPAPVRRVEVSPTSPSIRLGGARTGDDTPAPPTAPVTSEIVDVPLEISLPESTATEFERPVDRLPSPSPGSMASLRLALPTPAPAPARLRVTGLVVDAETRDPIVGATIRLDREGAAPLRVESDSRGRFSLSPEVVPEHSAVTATMRGYVPEAVNVSERDFERGVEIVLALEPRNPYVIAIEEKPEVHHLGNDEFTGRVNSQFQRQSEGESLTLSFRMDPDSVPRDVTGAHLRMLVKGVQLDNPIYLNGELLATLPPSPGDGSFGELRVRVPLSLLREGTNRVRLRSVDSPSTDVDDYEFVNLTLVLESGRVGL